ncbi:MAG: type IX secretion system sortase PorU [Saprospiraceae bacterium]|nr:type IX secretion system sortase PorU [Saprospiraceae bacterium]
MKFKIISFLFLSVFFLNAQTHKLEFSLKWDLQAFTSNGNTIQYLDFENAHRKAGENRLPFFKYEFELNQKGTLKAKLILKNEVAQDASFTGSEFNEIKDAYVLNTYVLESRSTFTGIIEVMPLRKSEDSKLSLLYNFEIEYEFIPEFSPLPGPDFTRISALSSGIWHKVSIPKRGLYKLDRSFFSNVMKVDVNAIDPRKIQLFGNGGKMLPESNDDVFIDDLKENAVYFKGESDGVFNDGDFMLFYADGPDTYQYDPATHHYNYRKNVYMDESVYYIRLDGSNAKRIAAIESAMNPSYTSTQTYDFIQYENDLVNLLDLDPGGEGSGKDWYGEELSNSREFDFGNHFIFENIDLNQKAKFSFSFAGRSTSSSTVIAEVEDKSVSQSIFQVVISSISRFANVAKRTDEFQPVSDLVKAKIRYPQINGITSEGWLDYFRISAFRKLLWNSSSNKPIYILDPVSFQEDVTRFQVEKAGTGKLVWDITDPLEINMIKPLPASGDLLQFSVPTRNAYKQLLVFDELSTYPAPNYLGSSGNQNLHGLDEIDMVIIYHSDFKNEAEELQSHRAQFSGLRVAAVEIKQIYNEFSSGSQDPAALRNFCRMLYMRNPTFKYLLLFGDGSYDLRYRNKKDPDENFIVSYETDESLDPITSFPSDDFFGLLDPGEGKNLTGKLDINIGRLVARDSSEAKNLVNKIIRYDKDPKTMGEWKLNTLYTADDEDSNIHFHQAETIAQKTAEANPVFNQEKIYLDAFTQTTTPGGERYPEVNKAIANSFFQGTLVMNYLGHGGYTGLAQERVFQNNEIPNLENYYKLPLVIVASCTFNGYDDPSKTNAGEEGLHNTNGGFLALFSTVRAVYSDDNFDLTSSVYKLLFQFENGKPLPLGEIMRRAKNEHASGFILVNSRKFLLFGDPAQHLAIPLYKNKVTTINDKPIGTAVDTFRALERVNVRGVVTDQNDVLQSDFNGKLYITVFDKEIELRTKANDPGSFEDRFSIQKNIIYKGLVNVENGNWFFSFKIPKDINYEFGKGKISLYATDEKSRDAAGYENQFIVGGVSSDTLVDDNPPVVKAFINDANFISGGICGPEPKLYAQISDDSGINISGNSIGHDLIAVIDQNTRNPIVLNQYYTSQFNNPLEGEVLYLLPQLSAGKHSITVTAWDVANNFGTGTVEFVVIDENDLVIRDVYNYPNPFNDYTKFQFQTNISSTQMDVEIDIRAISGQGVRKLKQRFLNNGYRVISMQWDGRDDGGSEIPNGVYTYKINIEAKNGQELLKKQSLPQKLVLLK